MIDLMPSRYDQLVATLEGLKATGVPLVQTAASGGYQPAGFSDDSGLYLVVPWIARTFGLSITTAADVFFIGVIAIAALVGLVGIWRWASTWTARAYGAVVLLALTWAAWRIGDVYILTFALPVAFVPWLLFILRDRTVTRSALVLLPVLGAASVAGHLVRSHAATALGIFAIILVVSCVRAPLRLRALALALTVAGALTVALPFSAVVQERDTFLAEQGASAEQGRAAHPFWHSVYIGLGYTENSHVDEYLDEVAIGKVAELAPDAGYLTESYEETLRGEVFRIAAEDPWFIVRQLAAKLLAVLGKLLFFLNVGAIALLLARPERQVVAAFVSALAFSALPALLTVPNRAYMLGMYAFAVLFAIVCVDHALWTRSAGTAPQPDTVG